MEEIEIKDKSNYYSYLIDCASDSIYFESGELNHKHNPRLMKKIREYEDSVNMPEEDRYPMRFDKSEYQEMVKEFWNTLEAWENYLK